MPERRLAGTTPVPAAVARNTNTAARESDQNQHSLWQRVQAAFQVVQSELMGLVLGQFSHLKQFAWSDYHFGDAPRLADQSDADLGVSLAYFIFRWKRRRKKLRTGDATIAQAYLRLHGRGLSELERQVVELGLSEPFTFYEVQSVVPGQEICAEGVVHGTGIIGRGARRLQKRAARGTSFTGSLRQCKGSPPCLFMPASPFPQDEA